MYLVVSQMEGDRLEEEVKNLPDLEIPGTDIKVRPDGYPSLTDGNAQWPIDRKKCKICSIC